jgi:dUTP pyrophosphatase
MEIKIKRLLPQAQLPKYAKEGDAGMDLTATTKQVVSIDSTKYGTGIAIEIPEGYVGMLFPRSSVFKTGQMLYNSVGILDSGFRGEISLVYRRGYDEYEVGDRIGQLLILPYPHIKFKEVDELTETSRGEGGYGSTGR